MNDLVILQTSQGLANYLSSVHGMDRLREMGAVIGFDARHNSARWAKLSASVFLRYSRSPLKQGDREVVQAPLLLEQRKQMHFYETHNQGPALSQAFSTPNSDAILALTQADFNFAPNI